MIKNINLTNGNLDVEKSDFSIFFKKNKVYIKKNNLKINDFLYITEIECEVFDVSFPYDLSAGTSRLKNNRTKLTKLKGFLKEGNIKNIFENHPQSNNFFNIELGFDKKVTLKGLYRPDFSDNLIPFLLEIGLYIKGNKLFFIVLEDYISSVLPFSKIKFIDEFFKFPTLEKEGINIFSIEIFPNILFDIFPLNGYKLPNYQNAVFTKLNVNNGVINFVLSENPDKDISPVPSIKKTLASLEIYKENSLILEKIAEDSLSDEDIEYIRDISQINKDRVKQKLFVEFSKGSFSDRDALKLLSEKKIDNDILFDIMVKLGNFEDIFRFEEVVKKLISILNKSGDYKVLEILYIYLSYFYKKENNKKSVFYFEKLWNLTRKHIIVFEDFFEELIKYKSYYLAVEVGEYISGKTNKKEYYLEKIGDIFSNVFKEYNKALEYYTKALRISPDLIFVKLKILDLYAKENKNLFVIDRLNLLSEENKENNFLKVEIDKRLASLWFKEKKYERSIFHIERALKEYKNPSLYYKAYIASKKLKDDLRAFEYLKLALREYEKFDYEENLLYYKILSDLAAIYVKRGEREKAYDYLVKIPVELIDEKSVDLINEILKYPGKNDELYQYLEIKEKFIKKISDKIKFWEDNLNIFKDNNDKLNILKTLFRLVLLQPENEKIFEKFENELLKVYLNDELFNEKIIRLYLKKAGMIDDASIKCDFYHKAYKRALITSNKNLAYKILKKGLKEIPFCEMLNESYKKWLNEKRQ